MDINSIIISSLYVTAVIVTCYNAYRVFQLQSHWRKLVHNVIREMIYKGILEDLSEEIVDLFMDQSVRALNRFQIFPLPRINYLLKYPECYVIIMAMADKFGFPSEEFKVSGYDDIFLI